MAARPARPPRIVICKDCHEEKENYHDGARCKECYLARNKAYRTDPKTRPIYREAQRRWERNNKAAKRAHALVRWAKIDGKLVAQPCEKCGAEKAEAHHDDYSKPLEVRWLCDTHHKEYHKSIGEEADEYDDTEELTGP